MPLTTTIRRLDALGLFVDMFLGTPAAPAGTTLDLSDDYLCWDNPSTITFRSVERLQETDTAGVFSKRFMVSEKEMLATYGVYVGAGVDFWIARKPVPALRPKPRDTIIDEDGTVYTVLSIELAKAGQTWHCRTQDLKIVANLHDVVTIERSERTIDAVGATIRSWAPLYTGLACRLQPLEAAVGEGRGVEGQEARYKVPVAQQLPLMNVRECRILVTSHDTLTGRILAIERYTAAEQIGELPQIDAILQA